MHVPLSFDTQPLNTLTLDGQEETGGIRKVFKPTNSGHGYFGYGELINGWRRRHVMVS